MKIKLLLLLFLPLAGLSQTKHVLFLGNSYTGVNNLPALVKSVAESVDDTLVYDSNTPGGYTLEGHRSNTTSLTKIMTGGWDYVVLQEQSQRPSFPESQVAVEVYPYAHELDSIIHEYNTCATTLFYMTWGRKNGDASNCPVWPPVCTYEGMDSLLSLRYQYMADVNNGIVSPVGAVWKYIRENYPEIELYAGDESHPSAAGSYAAALCFYVAIFQKSPLPVSYNFSLSETDANKIKNAVNEVVYLAMNDWHIGEYELSNDFDYSNTGLDYSFTNNSMNYEGYLWTIDGITYTDLNPSHTFPDNGIYTVELLVYNACDTLILQEEISIGDVHSAFFTAEYSLYPNPVKTELWITSENTIQYVNVYAVSGELLLSKPFTDNSISLIELPKGVYFLEIIFTNDQKVYSKILKH